MAGVTAHGASFSFRGFNASVVGVSVETPTAEIADMSGMHDSPSQIVLVPTGSWSGGAVSVEYLRSSSTVDPISIVRTTGWLDFVSSGLSFRRRAILESASSEARAGDLVRGTLRFRVTDYMGS